MSFLACCSGCPTLIVQISEEYWLSCERATRQSQVQAISSSNYQGIQGCVEGSANPLN